MDRRNTKQRQIILDAVRSRRDHPNAEQIYEQIKEDNPKISLGTVYRNLAVLADEGKILQIKLPAADRFDLTAAQHNHFVCEKCGKVTDIDLDEVRPQAFRTEAGYVVRAHQTIYMGLCPDCAKEE